MEFIFGRDTLTHSLEVTKERQTTMNEKILTEGSPDL